MFCFSLIFPAVPKTYWTVDFVGFLFWRSFCFNYNTKVNSQNGIVMSNRTVWLEELEECLKFTPSQTDLLKTLSWHICPCPNSEVKEQDKVQKPVVPVYRMLSISMCSIKTTADTDSPRVSCCLMSGKFQWNFICWNHFTVLYFDFSYFSNILQLLTSLVSALHWNCT